MDDGSIIQILLNRNSSTESWGFRLQGGSDFPMPLSVQLVTENGIAQKSGLVAGDIITKINEKDSTEIEHDEAKRQILACGNRVLLSVLRKGGPLWKPSMTLIPDEESNFQKNKFSLAANKQETQHIGSKFNVAPKPFFGCSSNLQQSGQGFGLESHTNLNEVPAIRPVQAPTALPDARKEGVMQRTVCHICSNDIIGVFPMVSGKPLHASCFKCSRCSKDLKNQGYYLISGALYCDEHAHQ